MPSVEDRYTPLDELKRHHGIVEDDVDSDNQEELDGIVAKIDALSKQIDDIKDGN